MKMFPYVLTTGKLKKFFSHIQIAGVPDKVTGKYLKQAGYTSSNDRGIISVLKSINFLDASGKPTDYWKNYRDKEKSAEVLGKAIKEAYNDLFSIYPNAYDENSEALRNYFSTKTTVGEVALTAIVNTFKTLCDMSNFEAKFTPLSKDKTLTNQVLDKTKRTEIGKPLTININIQFQLPATNDSSIYDKIFESLKKHLITD